MINIFRVGGHEERFVREAVVIASLFGIAGLVSTVTAVSRRSTAAVLLGLLAVSAIGGGWYWQTDRPSDTYLYVHLGVIAVAIALRVFMAVNRKVTVLPGLIAVLLAATVLGFFHEEVERRYLLLRRPLPQLSVVNGDSDVNMCFIWIRTETSTEAIIASNMWRLPQSDEQKYFLVSQKTKRRVLIDGPDYVRNVGAFTSRDELERLKNYVDDFVNSPTMLRLHDLRAAGANYLIVDLRRPHSSRLASYAPKLLATEACAIHML